MIFEHIHTHTHFMFEFHLDTSKSPAYFAGTTQFFNRFLYMETWCHRVPPKEIHNVASLHLRILKFYHALMQLKQLLGGRPPPQD